jgi:hypothetical protein
MVLEAGSHAQLKTLIKAGVANREPEGANMYVARPIMGIGALPAVVGG